MFRFDHSPPRKGARLITLELKADIAHLYQESTDSSRVLEGLAFLFNPHNISFRFVKDFLASQRKTILDLYPADDRFLLLRELMAKCFRYDPKSRPKFTEIMVEIKRLEKLPRFRSRSPAPVGNMMQSVFRVARNRF